MNNKKFWGSNDSGFMGVKPPKFGFRPSTTGELSGMPKQPVNRKVVKIFGIAGLTVAFIVFVIAIIAYKFVVQPAMALTRTASVLKADSNRIADALRNRDLVALDEVLTVTEVDLNKIRAEREKSFSWAKDQKLFKLNEFYADSDRFINAGLYSLDALREASKVVAPFADAAGLKVSAEQDVPETTGLREAFQTWISLMPEVATQMDGVIAKVDKIGEELKSVDTSKYPEEFKGMQIRSNIEFVKNTLSKTSEYAPDIKSALTIVPEILAVGTPQKRYMIIMQNDKEIRATGGFMTNYATFRLQNAWLENYDISSKDMYSIDFTLDAIDATTDFPDPPYPYMNLLKVERWYARDMNYSPDFVTSMDQFLKFYNLAGQINWYVDIKPVAGIFAIDTNVIKELLDVTGPVNLNGITYTADNVVLELERMASLELREQVNRKKVLGDLMEAMMKNVFESDKNLWPKLIEKAVDLALRRHIQAYVFEPNAQALIEKYNFGGRIIENVPGDYLQVVSTNLGGDKTNWFTTKDVTTTLEKQGDRWLRTVKINYKYTQPAPEFAPFVKRFRDWVRVYAPFGSEFVSLDGSAFEMHSDTERNKTWFSGYVELGPDESAEITFKYLLPVSVEIKDMYTLTIQKQGGILKENYHVVVGSKTVDVALDRDKALSIKL